MGPHDPPAGAGRPNSRWFAAFLLFGAVVFFLPFFFKGEHIVPFQFEKGSITGIPSGGAAPSVRRRFPGVDNSPVTIHYPNAALAGTYLRAGRLPTWNPYVGCGEPALANGQIYPFSPLMWPFYAVPTPWIYTLCLLLGCLWASLGGFLWLRRFGVGKWGAYLGAVLWAFNPWTIHMVIYSSVWAAWWFGWLLWGWDLARSRPGARWWVPAVMTAGMVFSGHPETALILAAASGLYALLAWILEEPGKRPSFGRFAGSSAISIATAGLLTMAQWLPVLSRLLTSATYKFQSPGSVTPSYFYFNALFNPDSQLFLAPAMFALALAGITLLTRNKRLYAVLVLFALSLLFVFRIPYIHQLKEWVTLGGVLPGIYARSLFWYTLIPFVAAGTGLLQEASSRERWMYLRLLLIAATGYWGLTWALYQAGGLIFLWLHKGLILLSGAILLALGLAVLLRAGHLRNALMVSALAAMCLGPLWAQKFSYPYFNKVSPLKNGPPAVREAKQLLAASHGRFYASGPGGRSVTPYLTPDLAALWKIRDVRVVGVLMNRRFVDLADIQAGRTIFRGTTWLTFPEASSDFLSLLGVHIRGIPEGGNSGRFSWEPVPDALPRAFLTHQVAASADERQSAELWGALYRSGGLRRKVILEGWTGRRSVGRDSRFDEIQWVRDGLDHITLKVRAETPAVLVLLDSYTNGWTARVDKKTAKIYPADLAFRGVVLPAGAHRVEFTYAPQSVAIGFWVSLFAWLALVLVLGWPRFRRVWTS
jgi:hypothetical protein